MYKVLIIAFLDPFNMSRVKLSHVGTCSTNHNHLLWIFCTDHLQSVSSGAKIFKHQCPNLFGAD